MLNSATRPRGDPWARESQAVGVAQQLALQAACGRPSRPGPGRRTIGLALIAVAYLTLGAVVWAAYSQLGRPARFDRPSLVTAGQTPVKATAARARSAGRGRERRHAGRGPCDRIGAPGPEVGRRPGCEAWRPHRPGAAAGGSGPDAPRRGPVRQPGCQPDHLRRLGTAAAVACAGPDRPGPVRRPGGRSDRCRRAGAAAADCPCPGAPARRRRRPARGGARSDQRTQPRPAVGAFAGRFPGRHRRGGGPRASRTELGSPIRAADPSDAVNTGRSCPVRRPDGTGAAPGLQAARGRRGRGGSGPGSRAGALTACRSGRSGVDNRDPAQADLEAAARAPGSRSWRHRSLRRGRGRGARRRLADGLRRTPRRSARQGLPPVLLVKPEAPAFLSRAALDGRGQQWRRWRGRPQQRRHRL